MPYKAYFQYANGTKSHALVTDSSRDVKEHLEVLLAETEPRSLAKQIIIMHGKEIILEANTTSEDQAIRDTARWRKVGSPQRMLDPITASIYMPKAVRDFLLTTGKGSLAAGMRQVMLSVGGPDVAAAYMQESDKAMDHVEVA